MQPERRTRKEKIDHQLARAGWAVGSLRLIEEFSLGAAAYIGDLTGSDGDTYALVDYVLLDRLGRPIAVIEAKRSSRDPLEGERQAADYADRIRAEYGIDPFIFLANGNEIWFWHRHRYPPRKVSGFLTEDDLLRLAHLDKFGQPLTGEMPLARIIDRAYQIEAVKTIAERIDAAERQFLLVLATGAPARLALPSPWWNCSSAGNGFSGCCSLLTAASWSNKRSAPSKSTYRAPPAPGSKAGPWTKTPRSTSPPTPA